MRDFSPGIHNFRDMGPFILTISYLVTCDVEVYIINKCFCKMPILKRKGYSIAI